MADVEILLKQWDRMQSDRRTWETHWEDLARVFLPRRLGFVTEYTPGERLTDDIYDGAPMQAARGLANAIGGMLRPEGQKWFFIKTAEGIEDQSEEAKVWLEDAQEAMITAMMNPKARFRQATGEADLDLVVFGTGPLFIGESQKLDRLTFQALHLKDSFIRISDDGEVDTMFRRWRPTARQASQKFGDKIGERAQKALKADKPDEKITYLQIVHPREDFRPGSKLAQNMAFASVWLEVDSKTRVSESGFQEFPFAVPRWDTSSGEDYGRSPGMIALPDANTLQAVGETILVAGQKAADPPLMLPDDGSINSMNTAAGGYSFYDAELFKEMRQNPIFPLNTGANLPVNLEIQKDIRDQIFSAYFRNVFNLPIDGPQMTATEVVARKEQFIREIGAVFGRLESDYTGPMIDRVFNIMLRATLRDDATALRFPPIPEVLAGANIRFEYDSPVRKVRQQVEAMAVNMWLLELGEIAKVKPGVLDFVNEDELPSTLAEAKGINHKLIHSKDTVKAIREQRAQAQQAEMQMQMVERGAEVAAKVPGLAEAVAQ